MRKSLLAIPAIVAFGALGMASPAFASGSPVHATVQVATTLTLSGINPTVAFGQVIPGTTSTVSGAQSPHVLTNDTHGAAIYVSPENGGFHTAQGQPDVIPDSAVSVTTTGQGTVNLGPNPVQVANATQGDHTYNQDWSINVDTSAPAGDPLFADFSYSAIAG